MNRTSNTLGVTRRRLTLGLSGVVVAVAVLTILPARAYEAGEQIIRVEEDWKLVLNEPNDAVDSPQFHTIMSPYGDLKTAYLQTTWNYWEQPDFVAGGLQLQAWNGDDCAAHKGFFSGQQLSTNAETVTWTQALAVDAAYQHILTFEVTNGNSVTWGSFGGGSMRLQGELYPANLNEYSPEISKANSLVTYGSNRVDLLVITEVRYYGQSGLLYRDTTPRVVVKSDGEADSD